MIRYPNALNGIEEKVDSLVPIWRNRVLERTKIFIEHNGYIEECHLPDGTIKKLPPFWSEIKAIFMDSQHDKCAFCETKLEGGKPGTIHFAVEHYRPKKAVVIWPDKKSKGYDFQTGEAFSSGPILKEQET